MEETREEKWKKFNKQIIDDFFDFNCTRRYKEPKGLPLDCNTVSKAPQQTKKREDSGVEYASSYKKESEMCVAQNFSKLNLTSQITMATLDEGSITQSEINDTLLSAHNYRDLPALKYREEILKKINENPVVIISGPTGCGKSTQVPQYIFDSNTAHKKPCNILISQPRRIAAITLAQRVAEERTSALGREIGYQVGLKKSDIYADKRTDVLYCTTGVILQRLIHEKSMSHYTHIIIDEIHERDIEIDFLLIIIRRMMAMHPINTKIIMMSATMDVKQFTEVFRFEVDDGSVFEPAIIDMSGSQRTFAIREIYLDNFEKNSKQTLHHLINYNEPGISDGMYEFTGKVLLSLFRQLLGKDNQMSNPTILIFLPGIYEIEHFNRMLFDPRMDVSFEELRMKPEILILHSSLTTEQQKASFSTSENRPKIILSTNIAESGVTIPNVTHVIDFCLTKYNTKVKGAQISSLILDWTSKKNCAQRAGRTGRVCPGFVIRMVTQDFFKNRMKEFPLPEMTRSCLESVVIRLKELEMGSPLELLALAIDPPRKSAVVDAVLFLKELGALHRFDLNGNFCYHDGIITYIGRIMASLPVDVHLVKLIVTGYLFSVLDETIIIAAGLSLKSIFTYKFGMKMKAYEKRMKWAEGSQSDCIAMLNAYNFWSLSYPSESRDFKPNHPNRAEEMWCDCYDLNAKNLQEMRLLIKEIKWRLESQGIKSLDDAPQWNSKDKLFILKIVIAGAFGPSNFFIPSRTPEYMERETFKTVHNRDLFRTVYFRNMDLRLVGDVYKEQLLKILISNGVIDKTSIVNVTFDAPFSQKVFVTFEAASKVDNEEYDHDTDVSHQVGKIPPEVYKAVKLRQIQGSIKLHVMTEQKTRDYALQKNLVDIVDGLPKKVETFTKFAEFFVDPTTATFKMYGKVKHVETCGKFFFCPVRSFGPGPQDIDDRYDLHAEYIELLKNYESKAVDIETLTADRLVIVHFKDNIERGYFKRISIDRNAKVYLIDRGETVDIQKDHVFTLLDSTIENVLADIPPIFFECTLMELKPAVIGSREGQWTKEAIETMSKAVVDKKASLRIYSVVDEIASVRLIVQKIDWNRKLVDDGFAEECEESYLSKLNHEQRISRQCEREIKSDPEKEFSKRIDRSLKLMLNDVPSPPLANCTKIQTLKGPFSPIEIELNSISRERLSRISIDGFSVNSVFLNENLLNFSANFCVAGDVTINPNISLMTIRETTIMPNIPGLAVLLGLIFSSTSELRRDESKTSFVSLLTGLGFDENLQQPFFGERDAAMKIDFDLTNHDLDLANQLRYWFSYMLMTDNDKKVPNHVDAEKEAILKKIQNIAMEIFKKKRRVVDVTEPADVFTWKEATVGKKGVQKIFSALTVPPLEPMTSNMRDDLKKHLEELKRCAAGSASIYNKTCELCKFQWENIIDLQMHLLSKKHINHCDRILES